jgi:hypothetical protein
VDRRRVHPLDRNARTALTAGTYLLDAQGNVLAAGATGIPFSPLLPPDPAVLDRLDQEDSGTTRVGRSGQHESTDGVGLRVDLGPELA